MGKSDEDLELAPTERRRVKRSETPVKDQAGAPPVAESPVVLDDHPLPVIDDVRYRDDGRIGQGGMGEVRACGDRCLGRGVALKRLRADRLGDRQLRNHFVREARIQGQLEHPAIVPLYDAGTMDGVPCFTMKRVRGVTLRDVITGLAGMDRSMARRFGRHRLLAAFTTAAQAVHYAHCRGVQHRDLKPQNIMLGDFGEVYVLDWGVASVADDDDSERLATARFGVDSAETGSLLGTAGYMAPEQVRGDLTQVDARSDVYALGAILFELLTLIPLNPGDTADQRAAATLEGRDVQAAAREADAELPPELLAVCDRATRLQRSARFASVAEMVEAIEHFLEGNRDAELRHAMSRAHTEAATAAARRARKTESLEDREAAMSQIGRALALDPQNDRALRLLLKLLTDPPKTLPPAVVAGLEQEERHAIRGNAKMATIGYAMLFGFVPVAMWMGVRSWTALAGMTVMVALCTAAAFAVGRYWPPTQQGLYPAFFAGTMMIAAVSTFFGSLIVVPAMAAVHTVAFLLNFKRARWWPVWVGCLSFVAPLGLQLAGILHSSYRFTADSLVVGPWVAQLPPTATLSFLTLSGVALLVTVGLFAKQFRSTLNQARLQARIHTWQLEQLIPAEARR
ncbi:MAG: protein kinase [Deltaproteobacteria bacterium]|nr:protein kinase [Deltaproteobacteria bacterium]